MQVVIFETFGISELQSRIASPVHICCASALNAKLEVDSAEKESANASVNPTWRMIVVLRLGHCRLPAAARGVLLMPELASTRSGGL